MIEGLRLETFEQKNVGPWILVKEILINHFKLQRHLIEKYTCKTIWTYPIKLIMGNDQIDYFKSGSLDLLYVIFGPLGKQILILIMIKIKYTCRFRSSSTLFFRVT